jgi:hypothetical protein
MNIRFDDFPKEIADRLRAGETIPGELRPVLATGTVEFFPIVESSLTPNAETIAAMEAAERGEFVGEYRTMDEFLAALDADD